MRGITPFKPRSEAVAFDGFGEDDGGFALEFGGCLIGGVDLAVVVAAAFEVPDLVIGEVRDEVFGAGVFAEEVFADEPAGSSSLGTKRTCRPSRQAFLAACEVS